MKTTQSFKFKNRQLMLETYQKGTPSSSSCSYNENMHTFIPILEPQSPYQSKRIYRIKSKNWNQTQQRLFIEFWLQKIIENPFQNFSFDAPLSRKSYNKALSEYIYKRGLELNLLCYKSPVQCKSKFGTFRRKIQRYRKEVGEKLQFGFIDFIIQKSELYSLQNWEIQAKIQKAKQLRLNQSPYVNITLEEYRFLKKQTYRKTVNQLLNFLEQNKKINKHKHTQ